MRRDWHGQQGSRLGHRQPKGTVTDQRLSTLPNQSLTLPGPTACVSLEAVSEILGHSDFAFTKNTYARFLLDAKKAAAERLGALMEEATRAAANRTP